MTFSNISKTPTMKPQKTLLNVIEVIGILLIGFFLAALLFKHAEFQYSNAIALSDIIGFIITILLALYLAHVVEKSREKKHAIVTVLDSMIQSLISECDDIQKVLYANNLNYFQAAAFPKNIHQTCQKIESIIEQSELECPMAKDLLKRLQNRTALRKNLTTITTKKKDELDFFEVESNTCKLGPTRIIKIQNNITDLRNDLFYLRATINL